MENLEKVNSERDLSENWYAIKLLFEYVISGEPDPIKIDGGYDEEKTYEESIYLIHADSFESAYEKAETEARSNEVSYQNPYGQQVDLKFVRSLDSFHLFDEEPSDLTEVYSRQLTAHKHTNTNDFVKRMFPETQEDKSTD
ncbi:protein of unknown function [Paenibacillus sp. NFR01]|nr:protein of unknown function [Paenibacillus sp. NFR01]